MARPTDLHGAITEVVRRMVKDAPNGKSAAAIAEAVGKSYATLMGELADDPTRGHKLGLELLVPLMRAAGSTRPLELLCAAMGGAFVPLPGVSGTYPEAHRAAVSAASRFGALCRSLEHAVDVTGPAGGKVSPEELALFEDAAIDLQGKVGAFVESVRERFRADNPGLDPAAAVAAVRAGKGPQDA